MRTPIHTAAVVLGLAFGIAGCAMPPADSQGASATTPARTVAQVDLTSAPQSAPGSFAKAPSTRYIRVKADQTGVVNADDDGRNTFLAFSSVLGPNLQVFDQEGAPLRPTVVGAIVGLPGVHKGILVKRGDANSYITPNPGANNLPRTTFDRDPDVRAVLEQMMVDTQVIPAYARALEKAGTSASRVLSSTLPAAHQAPSSGSSSPRATQSALAPLSAAPATDPTVLETSEGRLIRVFFASGGRAIVRPDDGLLRLESEAANAAIVRVVGYTDDIGSEEQNTILARLRATSIRNFLIARGIPAERVYASWLPKTKFIANNDTAEGRALNRRVEVLFINPASGRATSQAPQASTAISR